MTGATTIGAGKVAVVLFNLGGPDTQAAVRPFLFNLFNDPAILRLPRPLRWLVAALIAFRRAPVARRIYARLGGGSPILPHTRAQADALMAHLNGDGTGTIFRTFIAMRYWHPFAGQTVRDVAAFAPDRVVLLPLYPQFSTTTTASSLNDWNAHAQRAGLTAPAAMVCCYPDLTGFAQAMAARIAPALRAAAAHGRPRLLLSAHGLPERIVAAGDPYPDHCRRSFAAILQHLAMPGLDAVLCYQSRVGPLAWIPPATEAEVRRAGRDRVPLVIAPLAFVSDHSETLVEIDMDYRRLALDCGVPHFASVPAVGTAPVFIAALADLVRRASVTLDFCINDAGARLCGPAIAACPYKSCKV